MTTLQETLITASLNASAPQPAPAAQKPIAWAIQGCGAMWRGEFAEADAKAEAARCGGTCYAYPLYTAPLAQPVAPGLNPLWVATHPDGLSQPVAPYDPIGAWNKGFEEGKRLAQNEKLRTK